MLRFYIEVSYAAFRQHLMYRRTGFIGLLANVIFATIVSYIFITFFPIRSTVDGYSIEDLLRYIWVVQSMVPIILPLGSLSLMHTIRSGEIISDMNKPCDFYWYWFSREVGRDIYYLFVFSLPTYLVGMLLFHIGVPAIGGLWLIYIVSLLLGATLGITYCFLYNLITLWMSDGHVVVISLAISMTIIFGGIFTPLAFLPPWLETIANWLPFKDLITVPAEIFVGKLAGTALLFDFGHQALWLILLTIGGRLLTASAARQLIMKGRKE